MSARVLLNILNELGKEIKCEDCILSLFRNEFNKIKKNKSTNVRFYLKSHFCSKNVIILSLCMPRCYGRHNVSRKSVNH